MDHDVQGNAYLIGIGITAVASVVVAFVSRKWGDKVAAKEDPFTPSDNSQHSRTRDAVHSLRREMHLRFDAQDQAMGVRRQQQQQMLSGKRVIDGEE